MDKEKSKKGKRLVRIPKEGFVTCSSCRGRRTIAGKTCGRCGGRGVVKGKSFQE